MANCSICKNVFMPNKYHPKQEICPNSACQRQRRLQNMRKWRLANPDYFKSLDQESAWSRSRYFYAKRWKEKNKDYLKEYAKTHKAKRREYMRGYMRKYRIAKNVNSNKI